MDGFMKNVASTQSEFIAQKEAIQQEAELGETAAKIATKVPVSPETIIETVVTARKIRNQMSQFALPIIVALLSIIAATVSYQMYLKKE